MKLYVGVIPYNEKVLPKYEKLADAYNAQPYAIRKSGFDLLILKHECESYYSGPEYSDSDSDSVLTSCMVFLVAINELEQRQAFSVLEGGSPSPYIGAQWFNKEYVIDRGCLRQEILQKHDSEDLSCRGAVAIRPDRRPWTEVVVLPESKWLELPFIKK